MPLYRLRYFVETLASQQNDVFLSSQGINVHFKFSEKQIPENRFENTQEILVELELDEETAYKADRRASSEIIPPALDAITLATGIPFVVMGLHKILKDEIGSKIRRALYMNYGHFDLPVGMQPHTLKNAQTVLNQLNDDAHHALRFHRHAAQRTLPFEKFIFQWLAFENLAGLHEILDSCKKCGEKSKRKAGNRKKAFEILKEVDTELSEREFNDEIWGKLRNKVFHGGGGMHPELIGRMYLLTGRLQAACAKQFSKLYNINDVSFQPVATPLYRSEIIFAEWQTSDPSSQFPKDAPVNVTFNDQSSKIGLNLLAMAAYQGW